MGRTTFEDDELGGVSPGAGRSAVRSRLAHTASSSARSQAPGGRVQSDPRAFVTGHTTRQSPPLVPEFELWVGAQVIDLWEATEAWVGHDCPPPFWAFAWAGGQALARVVLDQPDIVRNRRVLDFGTGCGLVALAAARSGARHVTAVDIDPLAITACRLNAETNGVEIELRCEDLVGSPLADVDVVLVGDMFYERGPATRFWQWLSVLPRRGKPVYLGDPGRNYLPEGLELQAAFEVPTTRDLEGRDAWNARVWRVPA